MNVLSEAGPGRQHRTVTHQATASIAVVFTRRCKGIAPDCIGFHVHENASCRTAEKDVNKVAGQAAGPPLRPGQERLSMARRGRVHPGDLPARLSMRCGRMRCIRSFARA
ncbi:hypothetical protein D3872_05355 [Massilia cavernae]|uniref:Uncharacterized protein n=1 Tax=Massilia cavernae TaxID=2320864 RepID=A0A418Y5W3_9BURK|nr:hypothetical protein D3872_05355 [Massilia cavernae]